MKNGHHPIYSNTPSPTMGLYMPTQSGSSSLASLFSDGNLSDIDYDSNDTPASTPPEQSLPTPNSGILDNFTHTTQHDEALDPEVTKDQDSESDSDSDSNSDNQGTNEENADEYEPIDWQAWATYRQDVVKQLRTVLDTHRIKRPAERYAYLQAHVNNSDDGIEDVKAYLWQHRDDIPQLTRRERDEQAMFEAKMNMNCFHDQNGDLKWVVEEQQKLFGNWNWPKEDRNTAPWPIELGPKNEIIEYVAPPPQGTTWEDWRRQSSGSLESTKSNGQSPPKKPRLRILPPKQPKLRLLPPMK